MLFDRSLFTGRKLYLRAYDARSYTPVDVDLLPSEAITLLGRIDRVGDRVAYDEDLAYVGYNDRVSRLGWENPVTGVVARVGPGGVVWSFTVEGEDDVETRETNELGREVLLRALLRTAHPKRFGLRFSEFAQAQPSEALAVLEEWMTCFGGDRRRVDSLPVSRNDLIPLMVSSEPEIRSRAMEAASRLEPPVIEQADANAA